MIRRKVWGVIVLGALSALLALPAAGLADERGGQQGGNQQGHGRDRGDEDDRRAGPGNQESIVCAGSGGVVAVSVNGWDHARRGDMIALDSEDDCDDDDEDNDNRRASGGVRVRDATCAEGSACVFFIRNRGAGAVTASYTTANGTAIGGAACAPGVDYVSATGSVVIGPNTFATVPIATCSDAVAEGNETFLLNVTTSGATIDNSSATGRIREDGTAVTSGGNLAIVSATGGNAAIVSSTGSITVTWSPVPGATGYQLWYAPSGVCNSFAPYGAMQPPTTTAQTMFLNGTFCIQVRDQLGTLAFITSATGTAEAGGSITIGNAVCPAGDPCSFTVAQSGGSGSVNVTYSTQNGTALGAGSCPMTPSATQDYVASSGTVTVGANGSASIPIQTCASGIGEGPETFAVNLTGTSAGTIVVSQAVGTITL